MFAYIAEKYQSFKQRFTLSENSLMRDFLKKVRKEVSEFVHLFTEYVKTFNFAQEAVQMYEKTMYWLEEIKFFGWVEDTYNKFIR